MDRDVIERKLESLRHCLLRIEAKCPTDAQMLAMDPDLQDIIALNLSRAARPTRKRLRAHGACSGSTVGAVHMNTTSLTAEREHLANLLEALQRCTHFLQASASKVTWPLDGATLRQLQRDVNLFESLAAFNGRFAKLQDTLCAAMRHSAPLN